MGFFLRTVLRTHAQCTRFPSRSRTLTYVEKTQHWKSAGIVYYITFYIIYIDHFNKCRVRHFHLIEQSNDVKFFSIGLLNQFFVFLISFIVSIPWFETINEIEKNSKGKLKRIRRHWVKNACSVLVKRVCIDSLSVSSLWHC